VIWLTNVDGTTGRKAATLATGTATFTGTSGTVLPAFSQIAGGAGYETTADITIGSGPTNGPVSAVTPGRDSNLDAGTALALASPPIGVDSTVTIVEMNGGTDAETDDELRARILQRIRNPPMGGDADDYVAWALSYPGVTRAWAAPEEMGIGTMTARFLMDDLRADNDGWPEPQDILDVQDYLESVRPVTVKDFWAEAPIKQFIDVTIGNLVPNTDEARAEIESSLQAMLKARAAPGQTIFAAWKSYAIMKAPSVVSFDLINYTDDVMPAPGYMAVLRDIIYE
jgi:uncharacterized phage protein gp47/JayE